MATAWPTCLISHGANRFGGFSADGNYLGTSSGPGARPLENINRNTLALRPQAPTISTSTRSSERIRRPTTMTLCCAHDHDGGAGGGLARASPDRWIAMVLSPHPRVLGPASQAGSAGGHCRVGGGAASTLAIRMARQVEARTELQQVTQAHGAHRAALACPCSQPGRLPVQPMARRTQGWRCLRRC